MRSKAALFLGLATSLLPLAAEAAAPALRRPNIVFFLTDDHAFQTTGAKGWLPYDSSNRTFADYLKAGGYQTAFVGKYHLGEEPPHGFDYYDFLPGQGAYENPVFISAQGRRTIPGHVSDVVADLALAWLDRRDPSRPFVVCSNDKAAHIPWVPPARHRERFAGRDIPEPTSFAGDLERRAEAGPPCLLR